MSSQNNEKKTQNQKNNNDDNILNFANNAKSTLSLILNYLQQDIQKRGKSKEIEIINNHFLSLKDDINNIIENDKLNNNTIYNHDQIINFSESLSIKFFLFNDYFKENNISINTSIDENIYIKIDPLALDKILNILFNYIIKCFLKDISISLTADKISTSLTLKNNDNRTPGSNNKIIHNINTKILKNILDEIDANIKLNTKKNNTEIIKMNFKIYNLKKSNRVNYTNFLTKPLKKYKLSNLKENNYQEKNKTIFIVEDNEEFLYFLVQNMRENYNVYFAINGKEALQKLQNIPKPNLIISDIMMNEMNGIDFYNELSKDKKNNDIPFIFITAKSSNKIKLESFKKGVIDYIEKPFYVVELLAKVQAILKNQEAIKENNKIELEEKIVNFIRSDEKKEFDKTDIELKCFKYKISLREKQTIELIIKGYQNKEISDILKISQNTLKVYIRNIYNKCGVTNKVELTNLMYNY